MMTAIRRAWLRARFSIGQRLFLAVMLSFLAVAMVGVELVRWKLVDNFAEHAEENAALGELERLGDLRRSLTAQYRQHRDWSFLPAATEQRKSWLQETLARANAMRDANTGASAASATLGYRIGLLDRDNHYLAGAIASPWLVAIASFDTIHRPLIVDGATVGYLEIAKSPNPDDELAVAFLLQQQENLLIIAAIGLLLCVAAAAWLAARFR